MTRSLPPASARLAALLLAAAALPAAEVGAQACLGATSFAVRPVRLGAHVSSGAGMTTGIAPVNTADQTTIGIDVTFGSPDGPFGGVGVATTDFDDIGESAPTISGTLGYQIPIGTPAGRRSGPQLCPTGTIGYTLGPDLGAFEARSLHLAAGFSLGVPLEMTPAVRLVPFGGLSLRHQRVSFTEDVRGSDSESGAMLDLGAGFTFNDRFTVRPAVNVPLGFENADAGLSLLFALSFGGGR